MPSLILIRKLQCKLFDDKNQRLFHDNFNPTQLPDFLQILSRFVFAFGNIHRIVNAEHFADLYFAVIFKEARNAIILSRNLQYLNLFILKS